MTDLADIDAFKVCMQVCLWLDTLGHSRISPHVAFIIILIINNNNGFIPVVLSMKECTIGGVEASLEPQSTRPKFSQFNMISWKVYQSCILATTPSVENPRSARAHACILVPQ